MIYCIDPYLLLIMVGIIRLKQMFMLVAFNNCVQNLMNSFLGLNHHFQLPLNHFRPNYYKNLNYLYILFQLALKMKLEPVANLILLLYEL